MKTPNISKIVARLIGAALLSYAGIAWSITFVDPVNLVQNTVSAISQVKSEISAAASLAQQIKSNVQLLNSVASKKGLAQIAGFSKELELYNQLKTTDLNLKSYAEKSLNLSQNLLAQYGASKLPWEEFLKQRAKVNSMEHQVMVGQYASLTASMEEYAQRRKVIVNEMQSSPGTTAAVQSLGAAVDVLIGQNQQVLASLAVKTGMETARATEDEEVANQFRIRMDAQQKKMRDEANKY